LDGLIKDNYLVYAQRIELLSKSKIPPKALVLVPLESDLKLSPNLIPVSDPSFVFWSLYEFVERSKDFNFLSKISADVTIGTNSTISEYGVVLENGVFIGANSVIYPGVTLKKDVRVGPGSILGSTGFEVKRTIFGNVVLSHKGGVLIEQNVEIGANCTINQGIGDKLTKISHDTKIDCGVHVAHSCSIGSRNIIAANVTFGGGVKTGSDIFIGLNATLKNGISLPDRSFVGASVFVSESYNEAVRLIPRPSMAIPIAK
jgi:UDP-3-O-[3-hydroxymyristoyl] glucosamine N-acyltransferase